MTDLPSPSINSTNPILAGMAAVERGEPIEHILAERDRQLATPREWIDHGWDALAKLTLTDPRATSLVETMQAAWEAMEPSARIARMEWVWGTPQGAQGLWREAYPKLRKSP